MASYYNEHDPFAAAWLRELIKAGVIADGEVDERSITDVRADDLWGFVQCHFFAGIGGWSYALRLAGWPDHRPVWTGSCPCQPFSGAGKRKGGDDDRHLWPHWARLIGECRPVKIFGEQVESAIAHGWLDAVFDDLEREGYACGPACLPAASVGAFHRRQRVWFVAESDGGESRNGHVQRSGRYLQQSQDETVSRLAESQCAPAESRGPAIEPRESDGAAGAGAHAESGRCGVLGELAESHGTSGKARIVESIGTAPTRSEYATSAGVFGELGHGLGAGLEVGISHGRVQREAIQSTEGQAAECRSNAGFWSDCDWLPCRDGKWRPTQPGLFPLAHGVSARVGRLRGYGNAIVPQVAAAFIQAYIGVNY
jgi:DNA (cytosine-5)-methyltransferase 1